MARDWQSVNQAWDGYRGSYYPRDPSYAQRAAGGYNISASIKKLEAQLPSGQQIGFDIIPQVFGEEDPSVNSGLNGNEFSEILTEKEKEEKAWIAKRNKTLLLIGSLFLFG